MPQKHRLVECGNEAPSINHHVANFSQCLSVCMNHGGMSSFEPLTPKCFVKVKHFYLKFMQCAAAREHTHFVCVLCLMLYARKYLTTEAMYHFA